jgi:hypothetical protein
MVIFCAQDWLNSGYGYLRPLSATRENSQAECLPLSTLKPLRSETRRAECGTSAIHYGGNLLNRLTNALCSLRKLRSATS